MSENPGEMSDVLTFQQQLRMQHEITVHGYVRTNCVDIDIPIDIINLCVEYYVDFTNDVKIAVCTIRIVHT